MNLMSDLPITTPIENVVGLDFTTDYLAFCRSLGHPRNLVEMHKAKLGRQTTTFQGSAHRLWVWVRPTWTVFVGNMKGICFEVPEGTKPKQAMAAWREYKKAMG
jgi:hypothetical protein